jgi:hypothetical protein
MKGGKRGLTPWNLFVKKVYREGKARNSNYAFKDALRDASRRKREMGHHVTHKVKHSKKRHSRSHRSRRRH